MNDVPTPELSSLSTHHIPAESGRTTLEETALNASRIGFIGSGAVASALALTFAASGQKVVAVSSRQMKRATTLAALIPGCSAVRDSQLVVESADLVFLTVPDAAIESVCTSLTWRPCQVVVHCSGVHSVDVLSSAARAGAFIGGFHPLQTFAGKSSDVERVADSVIVIEADAPLRSVLTDLARSVRGRPIYLSAESKSLYHASAVLISNYVVALASIAAELWKEFDIPRDEALHALLPLLVGAVANLDQVGLPDALTGPIARGDGATIEDHFQALARIRPELVLLYRELGYKALDLALERGLDARSADAIREVLACTRGDDGVPN